MNWTIGVESTLYKVLAFAMNDRQPYVLKEPENDLPDGLSATNVSAGYRTTGDPQPVEIPQELFSPHREPAYARRMLLPY